MPHFRTLSLAGIAVLLPLVAACTATPDPASTAAGTRSATASAPAAPGAASSPSASASPSSRAAKALHGSYVALGDSYTAGLGVPEQSGGTAGCGQSTGSYPRLVARRLGLKLTDMSCSSATIPDLTAPQSTGSGTNPAQLSGLTSGTALVTVGIGGNDIGMIDIVTKCTELDLIPALTAGPNSTNVTPCKDYYTSGGTDQIERLMPTVAAHLAETLAQIKDRSPGARVYVVGYPDLLPAGGGGCGATLGITAGDIAFLNQEEVRLNGVLREAARAAGDGYVDTYTPSAGHDACAAPADRWLEPLIPSSPAAPLHPNAVGERGMAVAVEQAIGA
ncbi:MAG TPA: SGNH/GDSL hydrolase family protein [Trebonia sp.]|nr:SGNH/GDSL hydrolase family protein [Trebonia sp.]